MDTSHFFYLNRCLELALRGGSAVYPNPQVGAVIVHQGRIIGEGYHQRIGGPHAEVEAVRSVAEVDKPLLKAATIYVSLEPCSHFGRTPPCSLLIIEHEIPHVVIGCVDPNPKVAGRGVRMLREKGIKVEITEDSQPFEQLNRFFFLNQQEKRAYVTLKWAESQDGFIAKMGAEGPEPIAITGKQSKSFVHRLRAQHHAIMVGRRTARIDNPSLTTRNFPGRNPIRMVWDRDLTLPQHLAMFQDGNPTIVLNAQIEKQEGAVRYVIPAQWQDMKALMEELYQRLEIGSVLVEGGSHLLQQFLVQNAYEQAYKLVGDKIISEGVKAPDTQNLSWNPVAQFKQDQVYLVAKRE